MKQTASIISTYASDVSGVCSALFELGGMTIMHDASGCNSTYNTHDEPRWYDTDSMVYISGLTEMEAIMGDDDKLIGDIVSAARELSPSFIAIAGTPIPMIIGTDFSAVASVIEHETGIPTFGFSTNGMNSYISGASMAFEAIAKRFVKRDAIKGKKLSVNILGATPLDFSMNGSVGSMKKLLNDNGFDVISTWAMGSTLSDIMQAGCASVNLIVSSSGLAAARVMKEAFGTPYVVGTPTGGMFSHQLMSDLKSAALYGESKVAYVSRILSQDPDITIIGESVTSGSLAAAITMEYGKTANVLCPLEAENSLLKAGDFIAVDEDDLILHLKRTKILIADPLYRPICPNSCEFIQLPHEAFSGRIYRNNIPNLVNQLKVIKGETL